jgi:protoporphyrinogen oxidase
MNNSKSNKVAIIIGAGPAGLTAAYDLLLKTDIKPIIFEETNAIGGISRTVNYKGNRIDIGGHRFYSKHSSIVKYWLDILRLQNKPAKDDLILKRDITMLKKQILKNNKIYSYTDGDPEQQDLVMLLRNRISRIFYKKHFFDYPVTLNFNTIKNLGFFYLISSAISYFKIKIKPIKKEENLEDFIINRFGEKLYKTFFKDYTFKVWGKECKGIEPSWGRQRIKGLSVKKTITHIIKNIFKYKGKYHKKVETSLIGSFMYPKYGPGQLWERMVDLIIKQGGEIYFNHKVVSVFHKDSNVAGVDVLNSGNSKTKRINGDYFFSSMPLKNLILGLTPKINKEIRSIAGGLMFRDFIVVGLLLNKLKIKNMSKIKSINNIIPDNWIYVQEKNVLIGRLQIFNNWSPYLVKDEDSVWIGAEYFCNIGDKIWEKTDRDLASLAIEESVEIGFLEKKDVLDSIVIRVPKAYPAYFGTYNKIDKIYKCLEQFENLFPIGRNGLHRYNNMDHSMMSAILSVQNIVNGKKSKRNIFTINMEEEYHESVPEEKNYE